MLADVVDGHDVPAVAELGGGARLAEEPAACALVGVIGAREHLDRDEPPEQLVLGGPDRGHAPVGDMPRARDTGAGARPASRLPASWARYPSRAGSTLPASWPRSVTAAGRVPPSATAAVIRWLRPAAGSTRTCRRSGSSSARRRSASTSAPAASRPARSPRPSSAGAPVAPPRRAVAAPRPSLVRFRAAVEGALAHLESRRAGDQRPQRLPGRRRRHGRQHGADAARLPRRGRPPRRGRGRAPIDEIGRDEIVDSVARAALLGARGNSGVILSQLIRGAAEELISRPGELVDPVLDRRRHGPVGPARLRLGPRAGRGDDAHGHARHGNLGCQRARAHARDRASPPRPTPPSRTASSPTCSSARVAAGEASLRRGPDLLPVLREAGVVDAGGYGVIVIFAGVVAALRGDAAARARAPRAGPDQPPRARVGDVPLVHELRGHRRAPRRARVRRRARGDRRLGPRRRRPQHAQGPRPHRRPRARDRRSSTRRRRGLAASTSPTCTSRSPSATARLADAGPRRARRARGALAVVSGTGLRDAVRVARRPRRSTAGRRSTRRRYELLAGIHEVPAEEVVVLPNSPNVLHGGRARGRAVGEGRSSSCRRARSRPAWPRRSRSPPSADAAENAAAMEDVARRAAHRRRRARPRARTRPGASRSATRSASSTRSSSPGARPSRRSAPSSSALGDGAELVTVIAGDGAPLDGDADRGARARRRRARALGRRTAGLVVAVVRRVIDAPERADAARLRRADRRRSTGRDARRARRVPLAARRRALDDDGSTGGQPAPRRRGAAEALGPRDASARCSSTCRATRARRARSASCRSTRPRRCSSRSARSSSRPVRRRGMKPLVEATVTDGTGVMKATFFNQPWLARPVQARARG